MRQITALKYGMNSTNFEGVLSYQKDIAADSLSCQMGSSRTSCTHTVITSTHSCSIDDRWWLWRCQDPRIHNTHSTWIIITWPLMYLAVHTMKVTFLHGHMAFFWRPLQACRPSVPAVGKWYVVDWIIPPKGSRCPLLEFVLLDHEWHKFGSFFDPGAAERLFMSVDWSHVPYNHSTHAALCSCLYISCLGYLS